jgi:hypothetical protein
VNEPSGTMLRYLASAAYGYPASAVSKVLIITDGPEGIVASCTETDPAEIRGLMFRAGIALPGRTGT